jgi:beta-lactamase regulating signal transducer with metallopeptidase domain
MTSAWSAILNAFVLSVPLTAAVWLVLRLTPRRLLNAATRYVIWWIVLAVVAALPAFVRTGRAVHPTASPTNRDPIAWSSVVIEPGAQPASPPVRPSFRLLPRLALPAGAWMRWILTAWTLTDLVLLVRLLLSYWAVSRIAAGASDLPIEWRQRAETWRLPVSANRRAFRLATSAMVPAPVATGPFHPAILIPAALLTVLRDDELEPIALHEAAHLARRDDVALLLERTLEALFPLHPVIRWLARQINLEREIACDDLVVEATGNARRYAACLTRAVSLCGPVRGSLAAAHASGSRSHLSQRVELLVDQARYSRARLFPARLLVFSSVLIAAACLLAAMPAPLAFSTPPKEILMTQSLVNLPVKKLMIAASAAAVIAAHPAAAQTAVAQPAAHQAQVQPASDRRLLVLFFDAATLTMADQDRAVSAAKKFVETRLNPSDAVAIMMSEAGAVKVKQDFTSDRDLLMKVIGEVGALPGSGISELATTPEGAKLQNDRRLAGLQGAVQLLSPLPGRKAVVYFSSGMTRASLDNHPQLQATIDAAVRANVAFYAIDASGIIKQ